MTETIHSQIKELNTDDNEDFQLKLLNLGYTAQTWLHKKFYGYTTCFHNFKLSTNRQQKSLQCHTLIWFNGTNILNKIPNLGCFQSKLAFMCPKYTNFDTFCII